MTFCKHGLVAGLLLAGLAATAAAAPLLQDATLALVLDSDLPAARVASLPARLAGAGQPVGLLGDGSGLAHSEPRQADLQTDLQTDLQDDLALLGLPATTPVLTGQPRGPVSSLLDGLPLHMAMSGAGQPRGLLPQPGGLLPQPAGQLPQPGGAVQPLPGQTGPVAQLAPHADVQPPASRSAMPADAPVASPGLAAWVLDRLSADVWAQLAALVSAGGAALGWVLLGRNTARGGPAVPAPTPKPGPKRRRVAYRL